MALLVQTIKQEVPTLNKNNISLHVSGNIEMLPLSARRELEEAGEATKNNTGLNLIMALSYSSRWEIINAVQEIAEKVQKGELDPEQSTNKVFEESLCTAAFPDPELMIRTSGEYRISNFLLYQLAYRELYFTDTLWPDFRKENLYEAIFDYQNREQRFGQIREQL